MSTRNTSMKFTCPPDVFMELAIKNTGKVDLDSNRKGYRILQFQGTVASDDGMMHGEVSHVAGIEGCIVGDRYIPYRQTVRLSETLVNTWVAQ